MAKKKLKVITAELLEEHNACRFAIERLKRVAPKGVSLTPSAITKHATFIANHGYWLADEFLGERANKLYERLDNAIYGLYDYCNVAYRLSLKESRLLRATGLLNLYMKGTLGKKHWDVIKRAKSEGVD